MNAYKTIIKTIIKTVRKVTSKLTKLTAPLGVYRINDSFGTDKTVWTYKSAMEWLTVCSPSACISQNWTGQVVAVRFTAR